MPEDQVEVFDQLVERDGIGFNNVTLQGMPLMFSLGGISKDDLQVDPMPEDQ